MASGSLEPLETPEFSDDDFLSSLIQPGPPAASRALKEDDPGTNEGFDFGFEEAAVSPTFSDLDFAVAAVPQSEPIMSTDLASVDSEPGSEKDFFEVPSKPSPDQDIDIDSDIGMEEQSIIVPNHIPSGKPKPKRGRPLGSTGSKSLRAASKRAMQEFEAAEASLLPHPGSIEYARLQKAAKKQKHSIEAALQEMDRGVVPVTNEVVAAAASQNVALLDSKSFVWNIMLQIGSVSHRVVVLSAHQSISQLEAANNDRTNMSADVDSHTEPSVALFFEPNRHYSSDAHLAALTGESRPHVRSVLNRAAICSLLSAGSLWGSLFHKICAKVDSHEWQPILFAKKTRYDETPSKLRLPCEDNASQEQTKFAKAFQFELCFHILVKDLQESKFFHFAGRMPCDLSVCDRTTAECTKAVILKHLDSVPELRRTADMFRTKLQLTTIDRYSANFKAERSVQHDDPTWKRATFPCNIHRIAQVSIVTTNLTDLDVSGMIAANLSFDTSGTLHKLRDILRAIFESDLVVYYASPPDPTHRYAVYDVFLPMTHDHRSHTGGAPRKHHLLRQIQRSILDATLNGDLSTSEEIQHFCTLGCCENGADSLHKLSTYTTFALLPHKLPRFPRSRWSNRETAVCWSGLLASHHNLLLRVIEKFSGRARVVQPTILDHEDMNGFLEDLGKMPAPLLDMQEPQPDFQELREEPLEVYDDTIQEDIGEVIPGKTLDWKELNKQYRVKSVAWVNSNPGPRLVLMQLVGASLQRIMHKALLISGKKWERSQLHLESKGLQRTFRVLEAANAKWIDRLYIEFRKLLGL